ncbi:MAG: hypothetical protein FWG83_03605 [Oscillospiraceae bacterium]|nr:hypothetical protein [Oscillospiraceae bacterium]
MAQIDTKIAQRDKLFNLYVAQHSPNNIKLQISQTRAEMDKEDIEAVENEFKSWLQAESEH